MISSQVCRFRFRIRTRQGLLLPPLQIPGRDAQDAERKLMQIYRGCQILERPQLRAFALGEAALVPG